MLSFFNITIRITNLLVDLTADLCAGYLGGCLSVSE